MKKQLAVEFRRVLKSPTLYIAMAIGLFIAISQVITVTLPLAEANETDFYIEDKTLPHSVFTCMMSMGRGAFSWHSELLINIIPVLSALPFGISFYMDKKMGYTNNLYIREKKRVYLWAKYIVTFVSGGFVTALPTFVNFIGNAMVVPLIKPMKGTYFFAEVAGCFENAYYESPVIYILLVCFLQFIIGGLLASMCLGAAYLVDVVFLVQLFPVIFVYLYNMMCNSIDFLELLPFREYVSIEVSKEVTISKILIMLGIMMIFSFIYFYNGYKKEA